MSCLKLPALPIPPALPFGLSLTPPALPPLPALSFSLCCHINVPLPALPNLPSLILTAAILTPINALLLEVEAYLDQLQIDCPLE